MRVSIFEVEDIRVVLVKALFIGTTCQKHLIKLDVFFDSFNLNDLFLFVNLFDITFDYCDIGSIQEVQVGQECFILGQRREFAFKDFQILELTELGCGNANNFPSKTHSKSI